MKASDAIAGYERSVQTPLTEIMDKFWALARPLSTSP
jgi:hypothetical protein